jgi:hypothetical protein
VLADYEFFDPSIHAVWPPNRQHSAKVRALVDFLTERFGGTPYWDRPLIPLQRGALSPGSEVRSSGKRE